MSSNTVNVLNWRRVVWLEDPLYTFFLSSIRDIVKVVGIARCKKNVANELLELNDAFIFIREDVVIDLSPRYMCLVRALLPQHFDSKSGKAVYDREYIESFHHILSDLLIILYDFLDKTEQCLRKLEGKLLINEGKLIVLWWFQYLVILKELNNISKLFNSSEVFWQKFSQQKLSLCFLIGIYAKSFDDYWWMIEQKEVNNFKVRDISQ
ncbi:hypothetical protein H5410_061991 [Solanum commersonii]|uniref:Uncharacterized protein n=1 Tax=Solanum commersonii TaxID=4109 RepID=A0A9J5W9G8_SOLCO|nr:hypothetical protein H5410_061991 [Solanum commersonii]